MSSPGGSTPERRQQRRKEQSSESAAAAAVSIVVVLGNRDLLAEILLRVDSPTWLVRAALASKSWLRVASDPDFLDRFRALHPPRVLGLSVLGLRSPPRLLPIPQPPDLAAAVRLAGLAIGYLGRDDRCSDYCNGLLLLEIGDMNRPSYAVASLLNERPKRILPPPPPLGITSVGTGALFINHRMFLFADDVTSCLCLSMACDKTSVRANVSILRSGIWGVQQSAVMELQQDPFYTLLGRKLLTGGKLYMMTGAECILALDLASATFTAVEVPDGVTHNASFKFSRAKQSGLYLIHVTGFELCVWFGDGRGQWVLMDTISVCEACANLNVQTWIPDDGFSSPVWVVGVGDNAEFVILELVASGIVRVVEKVAEGVIQQYGASVRPITMMNSTILTGSKRSLLTRTSLGKRKVRLSQCQ